MKVIKLSDFLNILKANRTHCGIITERKEGESRYESSITVLKLIIIKVNICEMTDLNLFGTASNVFSKKYQGTIMNMHCFYLC